MLSWEIGEYLGLVWLITRVTLANGRKNRAIREGVVRLGPHPRQHLLTFDPPSGAPQRNSSVLFLHGGGWNRGSPRDFRFVGRFFAELGYPTVLAGYRLAPSFHYPAQLEDCFSALTWLLKWRCDPSAPPRRVIAAGQSAGAELAALLIYHREELAARGLDPGVFAGLVSVSGPLDFSVCRSPKAQALASEYVGGADRWRAADPIRYVTGTERVPVLCIHGGRDPIVELESPLSFARRVNRHGKSLARVVVMRRAHHSDVLQLFVRNVPETRTLVRWLQERDTACRS